MQKLSQEAVANAEALEEIAKNESALSKLFFKQVNDDPMVRQAFKEVQTMVAVLSATQSLSDPSQSPSNLGTYDYDSDQATSSEEEDPATDVFHPEEDPVEDNPVHFQSATHGPDRLVLAGPHNRELYADNTTGAWESETRIQIRKLMGEDVQSVRLSLFVRVMRYMWEFFPPRNSYNPKKPRRVPFTITVARCRETFRIDALSSEAWPEVSSRHPAFDSADDLGPVVLIKGTSNDWPVLPPLPIEQEPDEIADDQKVNELSDTEDRV